MTKSLYVVAGEHSGDAHGAGLLRELKKEHVGVEIYGVGGPQMVAVSGSGVVDWVEDAAVMGIWEVLKRYSWFKKRFAEMLEDCVLKRPSVLLLIDYPGFNLRFAAAVKKRLPETRIVYYISPQVWAWNRRRVPKMVSLLDEMMCLFPFERPIFEEAGLKVSFVGHPLVDELEEVREECLVRDEGLVGLFPGSREREVARLLPSMLGAVRRLKSWRGDLRYQVPAASETLRMQIQQLVDDAGMTGDVQVTSGQSYALMQRACCAVIASGTATLEAAYFGLPYCLVYRVAPLTYVLGRLLVKIKFIGLVNILAGREVVKELIQSEASPEAIEKEMRWFLEDSSRRVSLQKQLVETASQLGGRGAHQRAARVVSHWLGF